MNVTFSSAYTLIPPSLPPQHLVAILSLLLSLTELHLLATDSLHLLATDSRLLATDSHLLTDSRLLATDSRLLATDSRLLATDNRLLATDSHHLPDTPNNLHLLAIPSNLPLVSYAPLFRNAPLTCSIMGVVVLISSF